MCSLPFKNTLFRSQKYFHLRLPEGTAPFLFGYSAAMDALILFFERGLLRHKDLAKSLRAKDKACLDMRSDSRDRYLAQSKANR